ncbi:hypothetical protein FQY83_16530 [Luteimonas marina]|uniref:Uncharacterized protein n=1 Tax=Luteimonas marina TaxID=488485 RepID=A0A5C5TTK0_9GAMM|nr:hypothetical protein [Luteimonas marina]TWT17531.1 hypothetical protein FQY83_16530 [Luteimonas marina]
MLAATDAPGVNEALTKGSFFVKKTLFLRLRGVKREPGQDWLHLQAQGMDAARSSSPRTDRHPRASIVIPAHQSSSPRTNRHPREGGDPASRLFKSLKGELSFRAQREIQALEKQDFSLRSK